MKYLRKLILKFQNQHIRSFWQIESYPRGVIQSESWKSQKRFKVSPERLGQKREKIQQKSPGSATIINRSQPPTPRGR